MKSLKISAGLILVFITTPIWYYLLHAVLVAINADRLLWVLYWIYAPMGLFAAGARVIIENLGEKK